MSGSPSGGAPSESPPRHSSRLALIAPDDDDIQDENKGTESSRFAFSFLVFAHFV
jgi:hypothetical protein